MLEGPFSLQRLHESKGCQCGVLVGLTRLRREGPEKFSRGTTHTQSAMLRPNHIGAQGEKTGSRIRMQFMTPNIHMAGGRTQEDEGRAQTQRHFAYGMPKHLSVRLNGKNDGNRATGPGA